MPLNSKLLDQAIESLLTNERIAQTRRKAFDSLPLGARGVVRRALQRESLMVREPHKISVIVPLYNVEQYAAECLRSIVNQSYSNLEIIIVDDGSTDNSCAIAESFARKDKRVTIIRQANAGLGAARNTGLDYASGDFVVFADSDDVIPPNAYREMLSTLDHTGSDFVVGAYFRMTETSEYVPGWLWDVHEDEKLRINVSDFTQGLANVFAWNKLFRMSFVNRIGLRFPEGIRYEDQFPITRAYLLADSFDVIPEIVYKWRIRFDGTSITQNKRQLADVEDRVEVVKRVFELVSEEAPQNVFESWVAKVLGMDLAPYLSESLHADDEYRARIRELIHLLSDKITPSIREKIDVRTRFALYCLDRGTTEELGHVLLAHQEMGQHLPSSALSDGSIRFEPNYPEQVRVDFPERLRIFGQNELRTEHGVNRLFWSQGDLHLSGWAMIRHIDLGPEDLPLTRIYWRSENTGLEIDMAFESAPDSISRRYNSKWPDYDAAAFAASIGIEDLAAFAELNGALELRMTLKSHGMERDFPVTQLAQTGSTYHRDAVVSERGTLLSFVSGSGRRLLLEHRSVDAIVDEIDCEFEDFMLSYRIRDAAPEDTASEPRPQGRWLTARTSVRAASRRMARTQKKRRIHVLDSAIPEGVLPGSSGWLVRTPQGTLTRKRRGLGAILTKANVVGNTLTIEGLLQASPDAEIEFSLASRLHTLRATAVTRNDESFTARFDLEVDEFGHTRFAPYGGYRLRYKIGKKKAREFVPSRALLAKLPHESEGTVYRSRITYGADECVWFDFSYPSPDNVAGSLGQARLQRWHRNADLDPIPGSVFFQSYLGEQATDSALALHKELRRRYPDMKLYWGVVDASVSLPEGAIPVITYTRDWYEKISRAEYLVNNIYFFSWFIKRPFQTYLQTWHGTPLKKIGHSYWVDRQRPPVWINRMDRQAAGWDFLVAPNEFCEEKFAEEFRYEGKVLQSGYPRNDVLTATPNQDVQAIRRRIGIEPEKKVLLYAPTWRDNKSAQAWVADFVALLDLQRLSRELGEEYVILVRGHGHNARAGSTVSSRGQVVDVTFYPEINDLYLVADLAITDYSSVMFDFAITKKPLLFFVPDLAEYADGVRGFYFDYEALVPGPVLQNQDEVAGEIRKLLSPGWEPNDRYRDFLARFAAWEDGNASQRVVDAVWGSPRNAE